MAGVEKAIQITDWENWESIGYEPIEVSETEVYQVYGFRNKKTGERRYQIAKYLFNGLYASREEFEKIFGKETELNY